MEEGRFFDWRFTGYLSGEYMRKDSIVCNEKRTTQFHEHGKNRKWCIQHALKETNSKCFTLSLEGSGLIDTESRTGLEFLLEENFFLFRFKAAMAFRPGIRRKSEDYVVQYLLSWFHGTDSMIPDFGWLASVIPDSGGRCCAFIFGFITP